MSQCWDRWGEKIRLSKTKHCKKGCRLGWKRPLSIPVYVFDHLCLSPSTSVFVYLCLCLSISDIVCRCLRIGSPLSAFLSELLFFEHFKTVELKSNGLVINIFPPEFLVLEPIYLLMLSEFSSCKLFLTSNAEEVEKKVLSLGTLFTQVYKVRL